MYNRDEYRENGKGIIAVIDNEVYEIHNINLRSIGILSQKVFKTTQNVTVYINDVEITGSVKHCTKLSLRPGFYLVGIRFASVADVVTLKRNVFKDESE